MAGKGKAYWLEVWDGCHVPEYDDEHKVAASERMLKRYGYLWSFTTYGEQVHGVFFKQNGRYPNCADMEEVIYKLQQAIANQSIKEDGDLHQILQIIGEKVHNNSNFYFRNKNFTLEPRVSTCSLFNSLSCTSTNEYIYGLSENLNISEIRLF